MVKTFDLIVIFGV